MKPDPQPRFESDPQPHFTHQPFPNASNSIRLLQLHPGRSDEPLKSSLQICSLKDRPEYDALSYMWGPKEPKHWIQVDNQSFLLRPNIYAFLLRLRFADRPRRLWLDAICIDQNNIEERGYQVSLMRDIYQSCRECLAWLGESKDRGNEVVEVFKRSPVDALGMVDLNNLVGQLYHGRLTEAFKNFLCHHYWSRVWMIQETTLPDKVTVHCGGSSCLLDNIPTQVRGRMFELFQQHPVRYKSWLSVFSTLPKPSGVVRTPIADEQVISYRDHGRPLEIFPCLVGYADRGRHQCCLGFARIDGEPRWQAVVVKEVSRVSKDDSDVEVETLSETSSRSVFSIMGTISLSTVSKQYFAAVDFDPEDAFHALEAVFWCMKNAESERLLEERRRHSADKSRRFSSLDFQNFLETADQWYCTDIRDRIFGILGVFQTWPQSYPFRADYRLSTRDLMLEVVDYCRPTDPFKLAIRLRSALQVDIWDGQERDEPGGRTSATIMSRIAWPVSSFSAENVQVQPHEVDHHHALCLRRLDHDPTVPGFRFLMQENEEFRPSDELVSVGDAGVVIGVRKKTMDSVTSEAYDCIGVGFDLGLPTDSSKVYLKIAHSVKHYPFGGSRDNNTIDPAMVWGFKPADLVDQFQPLRYLSDLTITKAATADTSDDGTPILWWMKLPIELFWYILQREELRRTERGSEMRFDEIADHDPMTYVQDELISSSGVAFPFSHSSEESKAT